MSEAILIAFITGGISLIGTIITVMSTSRATEKKFEVAQAVMSTQITELTREVREHNNFARRMPVVEEQIKQINHRVDDIVDRGGGNNV